MVVGANYSTPVTVNGFLCKNCTDVDYAKKHIDPALLKKVQGMKILSAEDLK